MRTSSSVSCLSLFDTLWLWEKLDYSMESWRKFLVLQLSSCAFDTPFVLELAGGFWK